jgi:glycyl-tRNA synthetase beta chain
MAELLIELFSEEIPAWMQLKASEEFRDLVCRGLVEAGLEYEQATPHATPHRITLVVEGVPTEVADVKEEKRGPKVGAPEKAIEGFMRANGIASLDECEQRDGYWYAVIEKKGGPAAEMLPGIIEHSIRNIVWPKSMRWGEGSFRWVRPLHSIISVFDGKALEWELDLNTGTVSAGNKTRGHRFLGPDEFEVKDFADYRKKLKEHYVILDREERKAIILEGAKKEAEKHGLVWKDDPSLLDENAGLVEWPVVLSGEFESEFLDVPQEVLIATMRGNQKYFPLFDSKGKLANRFIITANMPDDHNNIARGNERVLRARLSDARFFWDTDREMRLEDRLPRLEDFKFHEKLGNVHERSLRLEKLAGWIAGLIGADEKKAARAGKLCKCDLVTDMVFEFTEVQGVMGYYYALEQGEDMEVAKAIGSHYSPAGPSDDTPSEPESIALALADKVDALTGFFGVGIYPTGSKDPFALRRAALGITRLVVENGLDLDMIELFGKSASLYPQGMLTELEGLAEKALPGFMLERLKFSLKHLGLRHDIIDAVINAQTEEGKVAALNLKSIVERAESLQEFIGSTEGENLLTAYRRAVNIVAAEEKKDKASYIDAVNDNILKEQQEKNLFDALMKAQGSIAPALESEDYKSAMSAMASLRAPLDEFFDAVLVNDNDPEVRKNRLYLLSQIRTTMDGVADFSMIEG